MSGTPPILSVRDLRIRFGSKTVVQGVSFELRPGEKLALVGESGSGKTITALSLLKLVPQAHVEGSAVLDVSPEGPRELLGLSEHQLRGVRGRDVAVIFQEPMTALNPLFTIGDQIAEVIELHEGLSRNQAWQRAVALLASTGIPEPDRRASAYPHQLSGGQRQRAMIAMALACQPKLLLADEPTTALDVTLRQQILGLLDGLQRSHQMAVLMITHDLNLVRNFADRVAVMEKGLLVEQGTVDEVFGNPQHAYTRKLLDSRPHREVVEADPRAMQQQPVLQARQLRVGYRVPKPGFKGWFSHGEYVALKSADLSLAPGQTLGVIGESGSGKSTLALAALGLQPFQGNLQVKGQTWALNARADKPLRRAIQVVFQDPFSSLSPRMTVEDLVTEGLAIHHPELSQAQRRTQALATLADVGLTEDQFPQLLERYPHEFSGGQRQRLALARALVVDPQALVLDEPTSALDVTIQKQILSLLQRLQRERGLSYLLITHDVEVVAAMAHHIIVMKDGDIVESGPALELLASPRHEYTRTLLASAPVREVVKG
ncbi:ABC transporter ATP-binding protein [Aquabacterium sp. CECT 9606]|uniref:ABC transporter ATP-binding protein n=1 Tax=Aquabacterium sp. CECT 9606 TaxID=2845822 RepID=UPI001E38BB9F|nr:dipeptide ABC transporter ATP-binding protein [Aquabacterium sp. CECT 9606]CAH0355749.1 putative ABC transporter ATP-binding protein YejF [Aquabacterium sp. CECT 9606]